MRKLLFFSCGILFPLFSSSDWEDDFRGSSLLSYGGMSFFCDNGCGNPKYDGDAQAIGWLCSNWLSKPLYNHSFLSWEDHWFIGKFNLQLWEEGQLFDTSLRGFFDKDDCEKTHDEFLESSSRFLMNLNDINTECQKTEQQHVQNVKTIEALRSKGACFVEFLDDTIKGFRYSLWQNIPIERALQDEIQNILLCQSDIEKCDQYRSYAENTLHLIDNLYRKIFMWCLEHHQPEGIVFNAAIENFIAGDYARAMEQIKVLISVSEEKAFGNELLSKLYLLKGQLQSEFCLYSDAVIALTTAIQKNPDQKEAYFERAVAYFELGEFEKSIADHLHSEIQKIPPKNKLQFTSIPAISTGIAGGIVEGAACSAAEFVPETLSTLRGMGNGLWAFSKDPVGASVAFVEAATQCIEYLKESSSFQIAQDLVPELKNLVQNYDEFSDYARGRVIGYIIGKYGTDVLLCKYSITAVKAYRNLKKANQLMTLEALALPSNAPKILGEANHRFVLRERSLRNELQFHEGRQGKHVIGHNNYVQKDNKSIFSSPDRNKLLKEYAGSGIKDSHAVPGTPGYVEIVDFKENIGWVVNRATGEQTATTWGKIHYAKDGVHIVPTLPRE